MTLYSRECWCISGNLWAVTEVWTDGTKYITKRYTQEV